MPKMKRLKGKDVIKILTSFDFVIVSQKGSHVKLVRISDSGREVLVIPDHKEIKTGTLKAIYIQTTKYIPQSELQVYFYNDVKK